MSEQTSSKKNTLGLILSWIFGVIFALDGISSIFSKPIQGLVMLIIAAVLLPPIARLVDQKWKFHLSGVMKILVVIIGLIIFSTTSNTSNISTTKQTEKQEVKQQITDEKTTTNEINTANQTNEEQPQIKTEEQIKNEEKTEITEETKPAPVSNETVSQKNAVRSAKSYLGYSAFSYTGLIKQLEYEKFSHADAVYGADNSGADWSEQAAKAAQAYIKYSAFSRGSLIEQLKYEGFTQTQAEHGADAVGLQ